MPETISSGLTLTIPKRGERNWETVMKAAFTAISAHDHSGGGKGLQVSSSALASNAISGPLIRLGNDVWLRSRDQANTTDLNLVKVDTSDVLRFENARAATRSDLGLGLGSEAQAYDADLAAIAALSPSNDDVILRAGGAWTAANGATVRTALGLAIGTHVQAYDANLTTLAGLGSSARTALGLAINADVQAYSAHLAALVSNAKTANYTPVGNGTTYVSQLIDTTVATIADSDYSGSAQLKGSGSMTVTETCNYFRHCRIGPHVHFTLNFTATLGGTAAGFLYIDFPVAGTAHNSNISVPIWVVDGDGTTVRAGWRYVGGTTGATEGIILFPELGANWKLGSSFSVTIDGKIKA